MDDRERIESGKDWVATRRAWIDQRRKQYEAQYDVTPPVVNKYRLERLEVWEFILEINEYELEGEIANFEEDEDE